MQKVPLVSLIAGWFPVAVIVAAVLATAACVPWEQRARRRVLAWAPVLAVVVTAAVVGVVVGGRLLPWPVPWSFDVWLGGVVLAAAVTALAWRYLRWRRLLVPVAVVLSLTAAGTLVNADYGYFPTWRSLFGAEADRASLAAVSSDRDRRVALHHGVLVEVDLPGTVSHFHARDAYVWLPPAYVDDPGVALPVVELLAGSPGTTLDWVRGGDATATADAFARHHHGVAPLLVMPDENGSATADTECLNGRAGAVETYLSVDVPAFMREHFQAATGASSLAVAGLSEGGTCAAMLALRHPTEYRAFGDFSGLSSPSAASTVNPALTTRVLFGGSTTEYDEHDPVHLLGSGHFPRLAGWFEAGTDDPLAVAGLDRLVPLARRAGLEVVSQLVPGGGHDFTLWAQAFAQSLPLLAGPMARVA